LASSKTLQSFEMPAGNYEFSFGIPLPCEMMDTVTSIRNIYHSYKVQIILSRRFKATLLFRSPSAYTIRLSLRSTIHNHSPKRYDWLYEIISDKLANNQLQIVQCQTDDGIQYCVSIPDTNIPFGCSFPVECWFAPLRKDLRLSSVTISVSEKHRSKFPPRLQRLRCTTY
jgi:hypothetical protein